MDRIFNGQKFKKEASKTKIMWTLGPLSRSVEMLEKLLKAGMNVARFNFSEGSHAYHQETLNNLKRAIWNTGILCAVMLDTKGSEIRTGLLKEGKPINLIQGQEITISADYTIRGDSNVISVSYNKLADVVKPGGVILCCDGLISLTVLSCDKDLGLVRCRCENSAVLGEGEIVSLPGVVVDLPTLTEKDEEDILKWGVPNEVNFIALSSVRKGSDLDEVRELLGRKANTTMLMSKFDSEEAAGNVDEVIEKTDAVMVVGGYSGAEMKKMMDKANSLGKQIITAIRIVDGETTNNDLTKAVLDCNDCVMLTDQEPNPDTTLQRISSLCKELESSIDYQALQNKIRQAVPRPRSRLERTAAYVSTYVIDNIQPKAIIIITKNDTKLVAKYRPSVPVLLVVSTSETSAWLTHVASHGLVSRGIIPLMGGGGGSSHDMVRFGVQFAKKDGICKANDILVAFRLMGGCPVVVPLLVD